MPISTYVDSIDKKEYYEVRVTRKSSLRKDIRADKRTQKIETLAEAQKVEKRMIQEVERLVLEREMQSVSWGHVLNEWELAARTNDIFQKGLSESTRLDYYGILSTWTQDWMNIPYEKLTRALLWRKLHQIELEVSAVRSRRFRAAFESVFKWASLSGLINTANVATDGYSTLMKQEEKLPEILTIEEIRKLVKQAKDIGHEWFHIWAVALFTGLRSGELFALEWDSIDFDAGIIYVHKAWNSKKCRRPKDNCSCSLPKNQQPARGCFGPTKGRYWRTVPLANELRELLGEIRKGAPNRQSVLERHWEWSSGNQAIVLRTFCMSIGIPSVKFHTLRACFATQLIKDGVAPATVMKICGWKDLKTMMRYIRLAGIEVKGATNVLKFMPADQVMENVIQLFQPKES